MSEHLRQLKPGEYLQVKGPISGLEFEVGSKKHIGMLAVCSSVSLCSCSTLQPTTPTQPKTRTHCHILRALPMHTQLLMHTAPVTRPS